MNATVLFWLIVGFITFDFLLQAVMRFLRAKSWSNPIPASVKGLFSQEEYQRARAYHAENQRLGILQSSVSFALILALLFFDGFAWVYHWAAQVSANNILQTLLFFGVLMLASQLLSLPFSLYSTFGIEAKYGFNKTTPKTYVLDLLKSLVLGLVLGGLLLGAITYVFYQMPQAFWWVAWFIVSGFSLFMGIFYTHLLLPLFNKLTPLEDGPLRQAIEAYAQENAFPLDGIMVMDGSKRSTKANAFFSGLGKRKRIVLFDTLIDEMETDEVVAVLAHEVGHYKHRHIIGSLILGILQTGLLFFIFGWLARQPALAGALGVQEVSFAIALIAFGFLYQPVGLLLGIVTQYISRKNEYEADAYAATTYRAKPMVSALKKLAKKHLTNLSPHPFTVFMTYSHPPIAKRISALQNSSPTSADLKKG